jgi:hypothetical protein
MSRTTVSSTPHSSAARRFHSDPVAEVKTHLFLVQEWLEQLDVGCLLFNVDHTLETDIWRSAKVLIHELTFVKPDRPTRLDLVVDFKLIL